MTPHPASCLTGFAFDVFVLVPVCSDGVSILDEPCPNVFTIVSHSAQHATMVVVPLHRDAHMLAPDRLDQCALDTLPVLEPVAILVFRPLIPLRRVEAGKTYGVAGYPYPVAIRHICLSRDRAPGPFLG